MRCFGRVVVLICVCLILSACTPSGEPQHQPTPLESVEPTPEATPSWVKQEDFNTVQDGYYISEHGEFRIPVPEGWTEVRKDGDFWHIVNPNYPDNMEYLMVSCYPYDARFRDFDLESWGKLHHDNQDNDALLVLEEVEVAGMPAYYTEVLRFYEGFYMKEYSYGFYNQDYFFYISAYEMGNEDLSKYMQTCMEGFEVLRSKAEIEASVTATPEGTASNA